MLSKTPAALLDSAIEALWAVLRTARPDEIEDLTWRSALADRVGNAVCVALPHSSIDEDTRIGDLLLAASSVCPPKLGMNLDIALAIAARSLYRRALTIEPVLPTDILARFDILLVHIHEAWLSDNEDLVWFVSQLRRQSAALIYPSSANSPKPPHGPPDEKHRAILELITGGPPE